MHPAIWDTPNEKIGASTPNPGRMYPTKVDKAFDYKSPNCLIHRDILLTETASFLDYLIQHYSADQFSKLLNTKQPEYHNDQKVLYPSDFQDVYDLEFNQLEYNWLKSLFQTSQ